MRRFALSLVTALILTVPFCLQAQSGATPGPKSSKKDPKFAKSAHAADTTSDVPSRDYSQEAFVIEQYRSVYHFENDGTGRKETIARVRVQSEAGVQQS